MFDKDYEITGIHVRYLKGLCKLAGNVPDRDQYNNFKIFNSYIDAYIVCPLIGYQFNKKGIIDNSIDADAGIMTEVLGKRRQELKYVYQTLMLVDVDSEPDENKRLFRAFNFSEETPEDKKFIEDNMKVYESYFLGGLKVLHEEFVEQCNDDDDYLKQIFDFVRRFYDEQDGDAIKKGIDKILNQ